MGYWRPAAVKGLQVQAGVFNLFDKVLGHQCADRRRDRASASVDWYTEPGSVRVSLTYQY